MTWVRSQGPVMGFGTSVNNEGISQLLDICYWAPTYLCMLYILLLTLDTLHPSHTDIPFLKHAILSFFLFSISLSVGQSVSLSYLGLCLKHFSHPHCALHSAYELNRHFLWKIFPDIKPLTMLQPSPPIFR